MLGLVSQGCLYNSEACLKTSTSEILRISFITIQIVGCFSSSGLVNNLCFCDLGHLAGLVDASLNGSSIYLYVRIPGSVQDYFYRSRVCADID